MEKVKKIVDFKGSKKMASKSPLVNKKVKDSDAKIKKTSGGDKQISKSSLMQATERLKFLSHPVRLMICCLLCKNRSLTVGVIHQQIMSTLGGDVISQSQLSQFLLKMKKAGLIDSKKEGLFVFYYLSDPNISLMIKSLEKCYSIDIKQAQNKVA